MMRLSLAHEDADDSAGGSQEAFKEVIENGVTLIKFNRKVMLVT
jgi:hypothetical protein